MCPEARIQVIPLLDDAGTMPEGALLQVLALLLVRQLQVVSGLEDPAQSIDVLSLSLGYYHEDPDDELEDAPLRALLQELGRLGVLVVAAAGNQATTRRLYPAAFAGQTEPTLDPGRVPLVSVGSLNPDGSTASYFSNAGDWISCHRPGAALVSTMPTTLNGELQPTARLDGDPPAPRSTRTTSPVASAPGRAPPSPARSSPGSSRPGWPPTGAWPTPIPEWHSSGPGSPSTVSWGGGREHPGATGSLAGQAAEAFRDYLGGDTGRMADLVTLLTPCLWAVARSSGLDHAQAEDVVQNGWVTLAGNAQAVRDPQAVFAWLLTTVRREAWRVAGRPRTEPMEVEPVSPAPGPESVVETNDRAALLWRHVTSLNPAARRCCASSRSPPYPTTRPSRPPSGCRSVRSGRRGAAASPRCATHC
nr:sigma factor [Tessaracoccus coleopterorum]